MLVFVYSMSCYKMEWYNILVITKDLIYTRSYFERVPSSSTKGVEINDWLILSYLFLPLSASVEFKGNNADWSKFCDAVHRFTVLVQKLELKSGSISFLWFAVPSWRSQQPLEILRI